MINNNKVINIRGGNNPMVGMTVAVAIEEAMNK